ncbi:MAG: hypothetical protein H0V22_05205 [Solirubrobacterales bacterium]|nr:hypothetical protein [Solirubrobacterales bacterium]
MVPRDDPEALGDALLDLADHPDRARAMGLAGRQRAEDRLNWDAVADRMLSAIAEALSHRRATDSP